MTSDIAGLIKRLALDAVEAGKPADILFGKVISTEPLRVRTDQKLILEEPCLILSRCVTEYEADISVSESTSESVGFDLTHRHGYGGETRLSENVLVEPHSHGYSGNTDTWGFVIPKHSHVVSGRKKVIFHLGLKEGENVILLRLAGGQRFLVLDRAEMPEAEGEWIE